MAKYARPQLTAIVFRRASYVSCTPSTSGPSDFEGLHLSIWLDNCILICNNSLKNAFFKNMIVEIAHTSSARSRGLHRSTVEWGRGREGG